MSDLIDRAEAISRAVELRMYGKPVKMVAVSELERLPSVRAERGENSPSEQPQMNELGVNTGETCTDTISRQAAIEKFEPWLKVDGYSEGELNMLKAVLYELRFLPPVQAEERTETHACDCVSRQAAIDALAKMMPKSYTPDGSHPADEEIFRAQEIFADCIKTIAILPSARSEPQWIPCSERLPDKKDDYLCSYNGCAVVDICEYDPDRNEWGFFYDGGWKVVSNVTAWMPLPEPYKEGQEG